MAQLLGQRTADSNDFNLVDSLQSGFTNLVNYLPQLLGALLVLLIGYLIAKILNKLITRIMRKARLNERLSSSQGGRFVEKVSPDGKPSRLVGGVVFWVIMLFVISSAIGTLNIPALTGFMNLVLSYLPNVIAALLIFIVAAAVSGAIGGLAHRTMGETATGRIIRTVAPALVMAIAIFMILTQLGIAPVIVTATYIALIGAIALASALAFGLGGREAAADIVNSAHRQVQEENDRIEQDPRLRHNHGAHEAQRQRPDTQPTESMAPKATEDLGAYPAR